jgi:hypothetical protein
MAKLFLSIIGTINLFVIKNFFKIFTPYIPQHLKVYFLALYFKTTDAFVGVAFCYTGTVSTVKNASCIIGLDEFCAVTNDF